MVFRNNDIILLVNARSLPQPIDKALNPRFSLLDSEFLDSLDKINLLHLTRFWIPLTRFGIPLTGSGFNWIHLGSFDNIPTFLTEPASFLLDNQVFLITGPTVFLLDKQIFFLTGPKKKNGCSRPGST